MFCEYNKVKHLFTLDGFYTYFCDLMKTEDEKYEKNLKNNQNTIINDWMDSKKEAVYMEK